MLLIRRQSEKKEHQTLAPYACFSDSATRHHPESEDDVRTAYQRDCHRIYHSQAFRRLQAKRQVLPVTTNDHIRTRLTHTLEVMQISRSLARLQNLNEDLSEAIALAHDLGHPPFGHVGEQILDQIFRHHNLRFEHNEQSIQVVTSLEVKSNTYPGLNLTHEVLDGLDKHRTFWSQDTPDTYAKLGAQPSLEAQLVNRADEIAYAAHDLEDALTQGMITYQSFRPLLIGSLTKGNQYNENPLPRELARRVIRLAILDLDFELKKTLRRQNPRSVEEIKEATEIWPQFSSEVAEAFAELKTFLKENYYLNPRVTQEEATIERTLRELVLHFLRNPASLPPEERDHLTSTPLPEVIKNYVSGMTDLYAHKEFHRIFKTSP